MFGFFLRKICIYVASPTFFFFIGGKSRVWICLPYLAVTARLTSSYSAGSIETPQHGQTGVPSGMGSGSSWTNLGVGFVYGVDGVNGVDMGLRL